MRQVFWLSLAPERLPVLLGAAQWLNVSRALIPPKAEVGLQLRVQLRTIPPGAERHRIPYYTHKGTSSGTKVSIIIDNKNIPQQL